MWKWSRWSWAGMLAGLLASCSGVKSGTSGAESASAGGESAGGQGGTDSAASGGGVMIDPEGDLDRGLVTVATESGVVEVAVLEEGFARVRLKKRAEAAVLESFAVDPAYEATLPPYRLEESGGVTRVFTQEMSIEVQESPLAITQRDAAGRVVLVQDAAQLWAGEGPMLSFSLDEGERVFGLGDKAKGYDRRGHTFEMWNTDAFDWGVDQDPLYKSFPVFVFLDAGTSHGLFIDAPTRAEVDVGATDDSVLSYEIAQGESVDLYLLAGPHPKDVVRSYTELTGRTPLPPYWSLGFHMSRYGYMSESEVRGVVSRFDSGELPLDVIWLDIDFQEDNAPFTVNRTAFPNFEDMVADFSEAGVRTVCITDLHIKSFQGQLGPSGYYPFDSGKQGDHFLRNETGDGFYEGEVWPGDAVFPEFSLSRTRQWWGGLYEEFLDAGVAGFWNDMNEPAIFNVPTKTMPEDQLHRLDDGTTIPHQIMHNAYGALNVRATFEGVSRLRPNERPFTLTRAAYSGAQRYSASWTGDNTASRAHLAATIPNLTNLGVSGYHFVGADVGGFDGCPSEELLVEWMELGAFQPFFRNHSQKGTCAREPWVHGGAMEARTKRAIERRYRYLPYIYTVFEEAERTGVPMMRPLWLEFPQDGAVAGEDRAFFVGADLLVAPRLSAGTGSYEVILPEADFFDTESGELLQGGGARTLSAPAGDSLRVFARAGSIIPQGPVVEHTGQEAGGTVTLSVFPGQECDGTLYVDDGTTLDYRGGEALRWDLSCEISQSEIEVQVRGTGSFEPWWERVELVVHGTPAAPTSIRHSSLGQLEGSHDASRGASTVTFENRGSDFSVSMQLP